MLPESEHGTLPLKTALRGAAFLISRSRKPPALNPYPSCPSSETSHKADTVFLPILENALKAQKLQSTLSIFEKSKFFFNLPGSILSSIKAVSTPSLLVLVIAEADSSSLLDFSEPVRHCLARV